MSDPPRRSRFDTTHWSLVLAARGSDSVPARRALESLCETYWYPLYGYARRQGYATEDARDLTQSFFAALIERRDLRSVRPELGRFRSFLLAAFRHFMLDDLKRARALKRGGGRQPLSLDSASAEQRYLLEPPDSRTPEAVYDRAWALTVLERVMQSIQSEWQDAGKSPEFHALKDSLVGDIPPGGYEKIAADLGTTEGAIKVAVHRLRRRFKLQLHQTISETVESADDVHEEIRHLLSALRT